MMALYYKQERFGKLDAGHFWLSETPDTVGSKSWDTSLPRMVTWVKLADRRNALAHADPVLQYALRSPRARGALAFRRAAAQDRSALSPPAAT